MNGSTMRTLGFRTHVLLTLAACGALAAALGMPWYGASPRQQSGLDGPMDDLLATIGRAVGATDGTTARAALAGWAPTLSGLVAFTALMTVLCLAARVQGVAREGLRLGALATLGVVAWKLVAHPHEELRHGALIAGAAAIVLVASAFAVAAAPVRRRGAPRFGHPGVYVPPPPPPVYDSSGSAPPPGV
jgi:hypothetical protein